LHNFRILSHHVTLFLREEGRGAIHVRVTSQTRRHKPASVLRTYNPIYDLKEKKRYWKLKEEALDRTLWRTRFGRGYGPVVRQTTE
jgi:hypothetical protein